MASVPVGVRRESDITTGRPNPNGGITLEEPIEELKQLAEARGLRVEEGDNYNEFYLFRGDEMLDPVWYLEEYQSWTSYDPHGESLEGILNYLDPTPGKKVVRRELSYWIGFSYGRKRAPDERPEGAEEALLEAAAKLAKKLAPGAVKVEVGKKRLSLRPTAKKGK
jgi:hypothetical protein